MLPYQKDDTRMRRLYDILNQPRNGVRNVLYGPPGAGLKKFIEAFLATYGVRLKHDHIYCCKVMCPQKNVKHFFSKIIGEINKIFSENPDIISPQDFDALSLRYQRIVEMENFSDDTQVIGDFTEAVLQYFDDCGEAMVKNVVGIRVLITGFDAARKLFTSQDADSYVQLFIDIHDRNSYWLGITVTSHRTIRMISEIIDCPTSLAGRFANPPFEETLSADLRPGEPCIPRSQAFLGGFNQVQMRNFYRLLEQKLGESLEPDSMQRLWYECGANPKLLSCFYDALVQASHYCREWDIFTQVEKVNYVFAWCRKQLDAQLEQFVKCLGDFRPEGVGAQLFVKLTENPYAADPNDVKEQLLEMGFLSCGFRSDSFGREQETLLPCVPALLDCLREKGHKAVPKYPELLTPLDVPNKDKPLRILHLSDYHYNSSSSASESEMRKSLLQTLLNQLQIIRRQCPIDYICFTGDAGFAGKKADYEGVEKIFHQILDVCEVTPDRVLSCPGNHDQDLSQFWYPILENQDAVNQYLSLENLEHISSFFSHYSGFCQSLSLEKYKIGTMDNYLVGVRNCGDLVAVCLNTAWLSKDHDAQTKEAWVGAPFVSAIKNALSEEWTVPVLTLMHHPVSCWAEDERGSYMGKVNSWREIARKSNYILCGHTHENDSPVEIFEGARILRGGCLYENGKPGYETCFYLYTIPKKREGELKIQKYLYHAGNWNKLGDD